MIGPRLLADESGPHGVVKFGKGMGHGEGLEMFVAMRN
jgi:hypothetical protein